jgi:hypothetical protein
MEVTMEDNRPNCIFVDPVTGEEYISSPEMNTAPIIIAICLIGGTSPFWIGLVMYWSMRL